MIYAETLPRSRRSLAPPLIAASDFTGHSHRAFLGREAFGPAGLDRVGVFVTDRYGELYSDSGSARDAEELPVPEEILGTLSVIISSCVLVPDETYWHDFRRNQIGSADETFAVIAGLKKRKGLESEPLPAKPQFTPSRKLRDITTTPGKNQNHLTCISASECHMSYISLI